MATVIVELSGRLDSTVLTWWLMDQGHTVSGLTLDYGPEQSHAAAVAERLANVAQTGQQVINLPALAPVLINTAAGQDGTQPIAPYHSLLALSLATAWAIQAEVDAVATPATADDQAVDYTVRPECLEAFARVLGLAARRPVSLLAPFTERTRADLVVVGLSLGAPLADTWDCELNGELHCGQCGSCLERKSAFLIADVEDPTLYEQPIEEGSNG